jgi:hypothetical protein
MENQAKLARKVSPAAKETMANQVQLDPQDHPDHQAQLEAMANPERKANLEEMPNKAAKVRLDPKEKRDHQDPLDPMETKDPAAKLVHPAQLDHPAACISLSSSLKHDNTPPNLKFESVPRRKPAPANPIIILT